MLNHSSLGLRISYYVYWAKNTTVTQYLFINCIRVSAFMASSVQYIIRLITTYWKLKKKCSKYETNQYDVINFSHKQLFSGHMISITVSLFPMCISIEMGHSNTYRLLGLKKMEKESNLWISFILVCGTELSTLNSNTKFTVFYTYNRC